MIAGLFLGEIFKFLSLVTALFSRIKSKLRLFNNQLAQHSGRCKFSNKFKATGTAYKLLSSTVYGG